MKPTISDPRTYPDTENGVREYLKDHFPNFDPDNIAGFKADPFAGGIWKVNLKKRIEDCDVIVVFLSGYSEYAKCNDHELRRSLK